MHQWTRSVLVCIALYGLIAGCSDDTASVDGGPGADGGRTDGSQADASHADDGPVDGGGMPCTAPNVLRYEQPGCGASAPLPRCGSLAQDAAAIPACSCAGRIITGGDYYTEPFAYRTPFPPSGANPTCDPNREKVEVTGIYAEGNEETSFSPCGSSERWWVTDSRAFQGYGTRPDGGTAFQRFELWARVVGRRSLPGRYGHLGGYVRELTPETVLEVAPASSTQAEGCRDAGAP